MLRLKLLLVVTLSFFSTVSPFKTEENIVTGKTRTITPFIAGGELSKIEDFPYQVSISVGDKFFCGGAIVSENYILTAAHCMWIVDPSMLVVRAGSSWWKNGTIIHIAEVIPHPEFDTPKHDKDVGVMKTVEPIKFTDVIQPVKLPEKNRSLLENSLVKVSGWGRIKYDSPEAEEQLKHVEIPVVPYEQCWKVYNSVLTKNMWCGGDYKLGGVGTCKGDSGGSAVQDGIAVGIISVGRGCGQKFSPTMFADIAVPAIRDFITEHTGL